MDKGAAIEQRKYVWDYFHMHASQRLTTFNFYIVISTLLATGLFATLRGDIRVQPYGIVLGLLLILLSFVFYKLDQRNKVFISNAENALKYIEGFENFPCQDNEPQPLMVFSREEYLTKLLKAQDSFWACRKHYTYANCFLIIFLSFGILGIIGTLLTLNNFLTTG
jgi:hypothetical protein